MDDAYFKKITTTVILITLVVLSFFLIKPILKSIIWGIILAFIFTPVYTWVNKKINSKTISASLICVLLLSAIILPLWFLTPIAINQSVKIYVASQQLNFVSLLKNIFPSFFTSEQFSVEFGSIISSFVTKSTNSLMNYLSELILNFPSIVLNLFVVFFTFFFVLRDKELLIEYIKSLLPFSKEIEKKLFESSKGITISVIYGQVVVGIIQGLIAGIGFFIFKAPNALLLTSLAILGGIFPIIGPFIVWVPVSIYMFIGGNTFQAMGILLFGIFSSSIDNVLRPIIISRRTRMPSSLVLIGMVGGVFMFGILGLILGPLILAYLMIILEIYRDKKSPEVFIQEPKTT